MTRTRSANTNQGKAQQILVAITKTTLAFTSSACLLHSLT